MMDKYFKWALTNLIFLGLLLFGVYSENPWAAGIALFFIWGYLVSVIATFLLTDGVKLRDSIPLWLDQIFDVIFLVILLMNSWLYTAILWAAQMIIISIESKRKPNQ